MLATQLRDSTQSVPANIAEGKHRRGGHQRECFGCAYGSTQEVRVHLRVAVALGYCTEDIIAKPFDCADKVAAAIWRCLYRTR